MPILYVNDVEYLMDVVDVGSEMTKYIVNSTVAVPWTPTLTFEKSITLREDNTDMLGSAGPIIDVKCLVGNNVYITNRSAHYSIEKTWQDPESERIVVIFKGKDYFTVAGENMVAYFRVGEGGLIPVRVAVRN